MRVAPGTFFVAVYRENCRAHCERARRLGARDPHLAEYRQGIRVSAQAKPRQPKRCTGVSLRLKILGASVAANASTMRSNAPDSIARWSDKVFGNFALQFP
jgi:predicted ATPase